MFLRLLKGLVFFLGGGVGSGVWMVGLGVYEDFGFLVCRVLGRQCLRVFRLDVLVVLLRVIIRVL